MEDSNIVRGVRVDITDTCHELSVKISNNVRLFGCCHPSAVSPAAVSAVPAAAHSEPAAAAGPAADDTSTGFYCLCCI